MKLKKGGLTMGSLKHFMKGKPWYPKNKPIPAGPPVLEHKPVPGPP